MKKGFRVSNLISFNISNHHHHHHVDSPLMFRLFSSSSSYNNSNRSNDGYSGGRPPPRRRSGDNYTSSNRTSRLSGFIDDNGGGRRDYEEQNSQFTPANPSKGRRDFDTNRKLNNYHSINDSKYRVSNRSDNRKSVGNINSNSSYVPFGDDDDDDNINEQNSKFTPGNPRRHVEDNKMQDVDGFLDRFKLGLDQDKNKVNFDNLNGGTVNVDRGAGEGEMAAEEDTRVRPPEDADEIFKKMKETGLIPNAVAMLHGLCSDGLVQDAMKLFGVMRERGSIPEVVIYTAVVEGFCKAQKGDEAIRIFRKMQGNGIVPNAFSYGVIVQGLVKGKWLDDGFEFCLEMVEAGHSPNLATFTGLVSAFSRERGLEAAQIVISKLKDKGFGFDEKGVRDFMEKKGPFSPMVWEAIFGKRSSQML
ncbi:putative tetratricopeptide-like helical domain superfamily [Helianthus annuus]|nr:putative tetratricopeptide-like helical domain superfamily [Helianthus annuus]